MGYSIKYSNSNVAKTRRRGKVVIGTDSDGYEKTATSGLYTGVPPVEGKHNLVRVYSSTDPDFYVLDDTEIVNLANEIGGSVTTVLEAKNYLLDRDDIIFTDDIKNDNVVTDSLVLHLDSRIESSFLDNQSTSNIVTNPTFEGTPKTQTSAISDNWSFSGYTGATGFQFYDADTSPIPLKFKDEGAVITTGNNDSTNRRIYFNGSVEPDTTYTLSYWLYSSNHGSISNYFFTYGTGGTHLNSDTYIFGESFTTGKWVFIEQSYTTPSATDNTRATNWGPVISRTTDSLFAIQRFQIEAKSKATGFVSGSRSQNTEWNDLSGEGNDASLLNGVSFSNNNLVFDNTNDQINANAIDYYNLVTGSFTIMLSGKKTAYGTGGNNVGNSTLFQGAGNGWNGGWRIIETNTGTPGDPFSGRHSINFGSPGNGGSSTTKTVSDPMDVHRPFFYAFSLSGSTGTAFLNGKTSIGSHSYNGGVQTSIGRISHTSYGVGAWGGNIQSLKVYEKGLSLEEIQQNYYGGPIVTDGLVFATDAGNLVSYEEDSTIIYSLTGSYSGSLVNNTSYTGSNGGGWVFDGTDDYIQFDESTQDDLSFGTGDFTLEAWFRPIDNNNSWTGVIVKGASGSPGYAMTYRAVGSGIDLKMDIDAPDNKHYQSGYLTSGELYHIVMVYDRDTAGFVYNNGQLTHTHTDLANQSQSVDNTRPLRLGTYDGGQWFMEGNIYVARIYDRALSSEEVLQNYNAHKSRFI